MSRFLQGLGERLGFAGIAVVTALAAVVGGVAASCEKPTAPMSSCEEDQPCWDCTKDGNKRCGDDTPAVRATCAEPASWCGGIAEVKQQ